MDTVKKISAGYYRALKKCSSASIVVTTYVALMILTLATVWFSVTSAVNNYLNQQTDVLGSSLATQAAFNATQSILTNDLLSLNVLLNRLVVSDNILSARVYNKKDERLAEASRNGAQTTEGEIRPNDQHRVYSSPIRFRDEIVGHVLITLDKAGAQSTQTHISNLLIGLGIFLTAITGLILLLVIRRLFYPISMISDALEAFNNGTDNAPLPKRTYREASELAAQVRSLQALELPAPIKAPTASQENVASTIEDEQFEIDFEQIILESERESCALYIQLDHLNEWRESMQPLQVANLLTPIYRSIFLSAEHFYGQVHQHEGDNVVILFQAKNSGDNLYMDAACCAELVKHLLERISHSSLYEGVPDIRYHLGLHKGCEQTSKMFEENQFDANQVEHLINDAKALSQSQTCNQLVIGEDIITLPEIQNRIILSLPEIIELGNDEEHLAYTVKDLSEKYRQRVLSLLNDIELEETQPHS